MANRNYAKDLESVRNFNKELEKSRALLTDEVGVSKELALQLELTAAAHQKSLKYSKENNNLAKQQSKVGQATLGVIKAQNSGGKKSNVFSISLVVLLVTIKSLVVTSKELFPVFSTLSSNK